MRGVFLKLIGPALVCAGSVAAACAATPAERHVVDMRGFAFQPARISVAVGDTVEFVNRDALPHTATAEGWDSGELGTGERWSWVPGAAGTVEYICAYHPSMKGSIEVR